MRLSRLRDDWEQLGETDPYWAVLSDPAKRGGKWDPDSFYASGREEIAYVLDYLDALFPGLRRGDALDFGCGPGRLTYALAAHFERATGVDISAPMIELAEQRRRPGDNLRFVRNDRDDLSVFPDASFDLVYSRIVLQHIPANIARRYVAEFVRLLRPDGLALFQLPAPRGASIGRARGRAAYLLRRRRDDTVKMQLFGVARGVVEADVTAAGGHVVHVAPDRSSGLQREGWLYAVARTSAALGRVPADPPAWRTPMGED